MNYLVTARKWRPQRFDEVVGQEHITTTLKNAIINNRVAHAYLFAGPRGVGKTTTARILAKVLNCLNPQNGEPCNECEMCKAFLNSQTLDIIEIDGASNRRIEEIRTLRESVKYAPTKGKYKVYIIDEVHMLTTESFNALLKTLEEPPEHTLFIFATTDVHKVPLTIISRCQRFDFRRIELNVIKKQLKDIATKEGIDIDDTALTIIAKKADGALRDAQSLFDQAISFSGTKVDAAIVTKMFNLIDEDIYFEISDAILSKDFKLAFDISQKIYDNGWNYVDFLTGLNEHFRNILTVVIRKDVKLVESAEVYKEKYLSYADKFSESDLLRILSFLNKTQFELRMSSNPKLKIEVALCHLIGLEKSSTISELISKIDSDNLNSLKEKDVIYSSSNQITRKEISNVRPAFKNEIKIPEVKEFIPPIAKDTDDFKNIITKWQEFVEQVKSEKLFFGSVLLNSNPVDFMNNKLRIDVEKPEDWDMICDNKDYLEKKTKEIFGKKIEFEIAHKDKLNNGDTSLNGNLNKDNNPLVNEIIGKLGAKEIKK
ncbi:MAG: DNA polymerase III subunit gamma/tau [Melioribacter sp.]|nr:DNA polymerase III subunit gamma/tau [Melioribacter sp.]